jgi:hypothetical protein
VANPPSFVPRDFLEVPEFFGVQEDVSWHLAKDYAGAARPARSREQHELAYRIWLLRTEHKDSVQDVADVLGQRRENLWSKLNGKTALRRGHGDHERGDRHRMVRQKDLDDAYLSDTIVDIWP